MNIDKIKEVLKKGKKLVICGSLVAACSVPITHFNALQDEQVIETTATCDFAPFEQDGKKLQYVVLNHTGIYEYKLGYLDYSHHSLILDVAFTDEQIDLSYLVSISNNTSIYLCDAIDCCEESVAISGGVSKDQAHTFNGFSSSLKSVDYMIRNGNYEDVLNNASLDTIKR